MTILRISECQWVNPANGMRIVLDTDGDLHFIPLSENRTYVGEMAATLVKWLEANDEILLTDDSAPETSEPEIPSPRFNGYDEVQVVSATHPRCGHIGEITHIAWNGINYEYKVLFDDVDDEMFPEHALDIAPTSTRKLARK